MDNRKADPYYIQKIITDLQFIVMHTEKLSKEQLEEDEVLADSVMFRLIQVSENSDKLTADFKVQHRSIPWRAMKGMRNRIVHEYAIWIFQLYMIPYGMTYQNFSGQNFSGC